LRSIFRRQKNARVLLGEVVDVDPAARNVVLADGRIPYDALIVAAGTQSSYYGHEEWREWAPSLKSVEEALTMRQDPLRLRGRRAPLRSGPATRLVDVRHRRRRAHWRELAGATARSRETLRNDFRSIHPEEARILLVDGAPRVLPPFPEDLSRKAAKTLSRLGVEVKTGVMVKQIDQEGPRTAAPNGAGTERVEARTVLWAAA